MKTIEINKNLAIFSGLLLSLVGLVGYLIYKFFPLVGHVAYYCQSFIGTYIIPVPYYLNLIPFLLLCLVLLVSIVKFAFLFIKSQRLRHSLLHSITANPIIISKLISRLGISEQTLVINSEKNFAFCLGIRKPKIYISTNLVSQLSAKEVEAVLLHEKHHLNKHDTFTMIIATIAHSIFPFFPLLGDLTQWYKVRREIEADRFAIKHMGNPHALTTTLKKFLEFPSFGTIPITAIADGDTLEPRIHALLNKKYNKRNFRIKHFLITLFSLLLIIGVVVLPVHAKEIHHKEYDVMMLCSDNESCMNSCTTEINLNKLYSEIPSHSSQTNASRAYTPIH